MSLLNLHEDIVLYELCPFLDLRSRLALFEATKFKVHQPLASERLINGAWLYAKHHIFPKLKDINHINVLNTYDKCIFILRDIHKYGTREQTVKFGTSFLSSIVFNISVVQNTQEDHNEVFLPKTKKELDDVRMKFLHLVDKIKLLLYSWKIRNEIDQY